MSVITDYYNKEYRALKKMGCVEGVINERFSDVFPYLKRSMLQRI